MAGGDAGASEDEAAGEAGALKKPGSGYLDVTLRRGRPPRDALQVELELGGDAVKGGCGDDWILKEGAGAGAVGVSFDQEHALGTTDLADSVVDLEGRGWITGEPVGEVAGDIGIRQIGAGSGREPEGNGRNDVAATLRAVEDAGAVGEAAGVVVEIEKRIVARGSLEVADANAEDSVGDLLPVGSNVLNGRAAGQAGDAGEAFHTAEALLAHGEHDVVPRHPGWNGKVEMRADGTALDRTIEDEVENQAVEAVVGDEEVAAASKHEDRKSVLAGEVQGLEELRFSRDRDEEAGRTADVKGGKAREVDVLLDLERDA